MLKPLSSSIAWFICMVMATAAFAAQTKQKAQPSRQAQVQPSSVEQFKMEVDAKATSINADLRAPQPPTKIHPDVSRQLKRLLKTTGCPDIGGVDGIWGLSTSEQFTRFLKKTGQEEKYGTLRNASLYDVKALFSGWVSKPDFDDTRNDIPQYCEPVAKCNLNNEIKIIINESENVAIRDLYRNIHAWNKDVSRQTSIQGLNVSERDQDFMRIAQDKLTDAEAALRDLFMRVVEIRYPGTCGLCTIKKNYERALLVDAPPLEGLTGEILIKYEAIWRDVEAIMLGILQKRALKNAKLRLALEKEQLLLSKEVGPSKGGTGLNPSEIRQALQVAELRRSIESDKKTAEELNMQTEDGERILNEALAPVRNELSAHPTSKIVSDDFRELMFWTTCFVGDDIYAKE